MLTINPTIGRRVLLFVASFPPKDDPVLGAPAVITPGVPFDAGIAFVNVTDDGMSMSSISCGYTDHTGVAHAARDVVLYDRPQDDKDAHGLGETYAVWMPYQFVQAKAASEPKAGPPQSAHPAARPGDVQLVKTSENGAAVPGLTSVLDGPTGAELGQEQPSLEPSE